MKSIEESLRKLQTDYIDLMLLHQPFCDRYGAYRDLEKAYKSGKLRAIGVSNFYPDHLVDFAEDLERCEPQCLWYSSSNLRTSASVVSGLISNTPSRIGEHSATLVIYPFLPFCSCSFSCIARSVFSLTIRLM